MACNLTKGRGRDCKDGIGGILSVAFARHSDIGAITTASGLITAIAGTFTVFKYDLPKHTGNHRDEIQSDIVNGTVFFKQILEIILHKLTAADKEEFILLLQNRLAIFVHDNNNNIFLMGVHDGAEVSGGDFGTGTLKGDRNGYALNFEADDPQPSRMVTFNTDFTTSLTDLGTVTVTAS